MLALKWTIMLALKSTIRLAAQKYPCIQLIEIHLEHGIYTRYHFCVL